MGKLYVFVMAKMDRFTVSYKLKVIDFADKTGNRVSLIFFYCENVYKVRKARELGKSLHEIFLIMFLLKSFNQVSQFPQLFIVLPLII
jgi:hypothetical protein